MARPRPLEVRALVPLLEQDWKDEYRVTYDSSGNEVGELVATGQERLAEALIVALDEVRASRVSYIGVVRIGGRGGFSMAIGPFPGRRSAEAALARHPAIMDRTLVTGAAVIPVETPLGFARRLKDLDKPPERSML